jgi:glutamate/tyrosine decarboxylase-like PLP-dependent enzyme
MTVNTTSAFPATGRSADELLATADARRAADIDWRGGKAFSLVYHPDDVALEALLHDIANRYLHENALNPFKYPSLVTMEREVVDAAAALFGTEPGAGTMSSGGTESIFLAVHTARAIGTRAGKAAGRNIVVPSTAHPAFAKACHYLDIEERRVDVGSDLRADVDAMTAAVDDATLLVVGSAPCYPFGVIDPIPALAAMASGHDIPCHVDACLGGWLLPFWERLGEPVPPWDFRVPGVTSLSADLHKYGYAFKGASVVLYRDPDAVQNQWFLFDQWPGGLYGSVTSAGTRPAAPIAGAWAALHFLGEDGYLRKAAEVRDGTRALQAAIEAQAGLTISGSPDLSVFEFGSTDDNLDLDAVGDAMDDRGWNLDRQNNGLHIMVSPYHRHVAGQFADDLAESVASHGVSRGVQAGYGGIAGATDR